MAQREFQYQDAVRSLDTNKPHYRKPNLIVKINYIKIQLNPGAGHAQKQLGVFNELIYFARDLRGREKKLSHFIFFGAPERNVLSPKLQPPGGYHPTILHAVDVWDQKGDILRNRSMMGGNLSMIRSISASVL
jgi:hypothetical protein